MQEKMAKKLCKFIAWYNESETEEWYHFYTGYLQAMRDLGMQVEIFHNEFVWCDGKVYRVEEEKDAQSDLS